MKQRKIKIAFRNLDDFIAKTKDSLKTLKKDIDKKGVIFFDSPQSFRTFFNSQKIEILSILANKAPASLYELASLLDRDYPAVYRDCQALLALDFIELKETQDNNKNIKKPVLKGNYSLIEVHLPTTAYKIDLAIEA